MIDPKLDKLAEPLEEDMEDRLPTDVSAEQEGPNRARRRRGLSINDTVAANANLSVGGRGVDVSGVRSGAGAGAGMTMTTPGESGESAAPNIIPGSSSTGTTPQGQVASDQIPTLRLEGPTREEIAARAYSCWHQRGCPEGSPEEDWRRAEEELRAERQAGKKARVASA